LKKILLLSTVVILFSCKSSKNSDDKINEDLKTISSVCSEEGDCSFVVHRNSSLNILEDTIGQIYPVIEEGKNVVIEFTYEVKGPEGTMDGDYSETVHFEIPETLDKLNLKNQELAQIKLLFGKHCFCRGEAGYYIVSEGSISIENKNDVLHLDLDIIINEVSHKVDSISHRFKI
jgi:hypothetical protein